MPLTDDTIAWCLDPSNPITLSEESTTSSDSLERTAHAKAVEKMRRKSDYVPMNNCMQMHSKELTEIVFPSERVMGSLAKQYHKLVGFCGQWNVAYTIQLIPC